MLFAKNRLFFFCGCGGGEGQRLTSGVSLICHRTSNWLDWLASKPREPSHPYLPSVKITGANSHAWILCVCIEAPGVQTQYSHGKHCASQLMSPASQTILCPSSCAQWYCFICLFFSLLPISERTSLPALPIPSAVQDVVVYKSCLPQFTWDACRLGGDCGSSQRVEGRLLR